MADSLLKDQPRIRKLEERITNIENEGEIGTKGTAITRTIITTTTRIATTRITATTTR